MRITPLATLLAAFLCLPACSKEEQSSAQPSQTTTTTTTTTTTPPGGGGDPTAKAQQIFAERCTPCHGAEGRGDGAASASLNPKPRNFHDPEWQKTVTDEYLVQIIKMGGGAVGKSAAMPGNPDLKDDAVLTALAAKIRELGKNP